MVVESNQRLLQLVPEASALILFRKWLWLYLSISLSLSLLLTKLAWKQSLYFELKRKMSTET
jgi:hypothetical protein